MSVTHTSTPLPVPNSLSGQNLDNAQQTQNGVAVQRQISCIGDPVQTADSGIMQVLFGALVTSGGLSTTPIAAGVTGDTVVKNAAGRLCRVLVTTTGTNPLAIWDNASGHTGTIIGQLPASPAVGTVYDFQLPAANGITVQGNAANPAVTVSFV